jgi:hypothetical protein
MSEFWYYAQDNETYGPVTLDQLIKLLISKLPKPKEVPVWREGFDDWKPAKQVPEIAERLIRPPVLPQSSVANRSRGVTKAAQQGAAADKEGLHPRSQAADKAEPSISKREKLFSFLVFVFFTVFLIGYLFYSPPKFSTFRDWLLVAAVILLPIFAINSWRSWRNDWSTEKEEESLTRWLGYTALVPILLLVAVIAGFALFSFFGWFATIPSWAAVIIFLLYLIYTKK